ncbi:SRPBCC family protein [Actinomadura roseirufa]|uniref:SRPBCC family protein n=1 Tax=Actinomadura roseirufa TaxID=2094049 RepID=UPI0010419296|nr:SRPBCC family protein [Actinomadura roseirufa]
MKRGTRVGGLPVGRIAERLPIGGRKSRTPDLGRITSRVARTLPGTGRSGKGLPGGLPGGRAAGTAGGILLGAGAAVAAGRALSRRGGGSNGEEPEPKDGERGDAASKDTGASGSKAASKDEKDAPAKTSSKGSSKGSAKGASAGDESGDEGKPSGKGVFGRIAATVGKALKGGGQRGGKKVKVTNIVEHSDVGAPRRLVYDQWTRFQDYPSFMKKVVSVDQAEDGKLHWKAKIFWSNRSWESTIVEQVPDQHIVWRSKGPKGHVDGTVSFHALAPNLTRVLLVLEYHPQGLFERTGNLWRAQGRRVRLELKHFRRYVMTQSLTRPDEIEGWRGEIHDSEVVRTHEDAVKEENDEKKQDGKQRSRRRQETKRQDEEHQDDEQYEKVR